MIPRSHADKGQSVSVDSAIMGKASEDAPWQQVDPLVAFLRGRLGLTPLRFSLTITLLGALGASLISAVSGKLITQGDEVGLLQDWSALVWMLVFTPALTGYYLWAPEAIFTILERLRTSGAVEIGREDYQRIGLVYAGTGAYKYVALVVALLVSVPFYTERANLVGWASNSVLAKLGATLGFFVGCYMVVMLLLTLVINVLVLRALLGEKRFTVNPLHPDRCGGLRALSDYALRTAYLIAVFAFLMGSTAYRFVVLDVTGRYAVLILLVPLFGLLSALVFFLPLATAHRGMREAKDRLLAQIADQFQEDYALTQAALQADEQALKSRLEKVEQLQALYQLTQDFPVWPFDAGTVRRFVASILVPLLPPLLAIAFQLFLQNWLTPA